MTEGSLRSPRLIARVSARTDTGISRDHNEDSQLIWAFRHQRAVPEGEWAAVDLRESPILLVVSDGVGGTAAGEVASRLVVETLASRAWFNPLAGAPQIAEWLSEGVYEISHRALDLMERDPRLRGMGATVTAAVLTEDRMIIAQVGDSRAYVARDQGIHQVTRDQSFVQELIDRGDLTREEARTHPHKNLIMQAVGNATPPTPDVTEFTVRSGDKILLCSDGLSDMIDDFDIGSILHGDEDPAEQCSAMIRAANGRGGLDNITAAIAHIL